MLLIDASSPLGFFEFPGVLVDSIAVPCFSGHNWKSWDELKIEIILVVKKKPTWFCKYQQALWSPAPEE